MTLHEIKIAIEHGQTVHWSNDSYTVVKGKFDYFIKHVSGNSIGLTWADGVTLNGQEGEFYIEPWVIKSYGHIQ